MQFLINKSIVPGRLVDIRTAREQQCHAKSFIYLLIFME